MGWWFFVTNENSSIGKMSFHVFHVFHVRNYVKYTIENKRRNEKWHKYVWSDHIWYYVSGLYGSCHLRSKLFDITGAFDGVIKIFGYKCKWRSANEFSWLRIFMDCICYFHWIEYSNWILNLVISTGFLLFSSKTGIDCEYVSLVESEKWWLNTWSELNLQSSWDCFKAANQCESQ